MKAKEMDKGSERGGVNEYHILRVSQDGRQLQMTNELNPLFPPYVQDRVNS